MPLIWFDPRQLKVLKNDLILLLALLMNQYLVADSGHGTSNGCNAKYHD